MRTKILSFFVVLVLLLTCGALCPAQPAPDENTEKPTAPVIGPYLRTANLTRLAAGRSNVFLNGKPFQIGMSPGYLVPYMPISTGRALFELKDSSGEATLASSETNFVSGENFFTLMLREKGGKTTLEILEDKVLPKPQPDANAPPVFPLNRLRIYAYSSVIDLELDAGDLGHWKAKDGAIELELQDVTSTKVRMLTVSYLNRNGVKLTRGFPLDLETSPYSSIYVFDSGTNRCGIRVYEDNKVFVPETE